MTVPTINQLHRPILEIVSENEDYIHYRQIRELLINRLLLNEADVEIGGTYRDRFVQYVADAIQNLRKAGLVESPSERDFRCLATHEGREFLISHHGDISGRDLSRLRQQGLVSEYRTAEPDASVGDSDTSRTPSKEQMRNLHDKLSGELVDKLLEAVKVISPDSFEYLVVRLLERMGYGKGEVVGRSGDEGIDGIINQDPLGLEKVYIQAKRWQSPVGEPEIRNFSGSLEAKGASKGVLITTSTFSPTAQQSARNISTGGKFIRLVDGRELASLMIGHGVGVVTETTYEIKEMDESYFVDL